MHVNLFLMTLLLLGVSADDDLMTLINSVFKQNLGLPTEEPRFQTVTPPVERNEVLDKSLKSCGFGKRCVPGYLCANAVKNNDGATLINVRFDEDEPKECPFLETCCLKNDIVKDPIVRPSETTSGCGYRNIDGVGFKIDGADNDSEFGEFPWMLAILNLRKDIDLVIYRCGGSLIHPRVALTGAHCVHNTPADNLKVRAGEWETNSQLELYPHQERLVVDMVVHPNYNERNLHNDVALLFLETPFDLVPNVNTVCLPPAGFNSDFSKCYASGWGKDKFQNGDYQNILKKIELPVVPNYLCQDYLRKTRLGEYFELHWSFMCAGGERGKDTCEGDGGSPLVCPISNQVNRFYQSGMVAWGIGCGDEFVPGVYVNVAQFRPWIDEQLAYRKIDSSSYTP